MDYQRVLDEIPDYKEFLTVDELDASSIELASRYPDRVELTVIGKSRKGHPIRCIKIGNGKRRVLAFACPHPNEPIGTMTLEYFSCWLAKDPAFVKGMDCTWYLIKCVDPDGTKLNEGWFKGPFTVRNYAEHYYRPAMNEQVEWTFPIDYKNLHFHSPIPETRALMELIEEIRPDFLYSLHNAGFGGVFWYISKDRPQIYERLGSIPLKYGIPLSLGEPEMPCCESLAPAVYKMLSAEDVYDFYEKYVCPDPSEIMNNGACSDSYANRFGNTLTLVCELPYFYSTQVNDEKFTDMTRCDAMLHSCRLSEHCCQFLREQAEAIKGLVNEDNPFYKMILDLVRMMGADSEGKIRMIKQNPDFQQPAKVCEVFDNLYGNTFNWMVSVGLLVHMVREIRKEGVPVAKELEDAYFAGMKELEKMEAYINDHVDYETIPIRKLIAIQLECAFLALEYVED